jgi:hypothetical protein
MHKLVLWSVVALTVGTAAAVAELPVKLDEFAPVEDLVAEANDRIADLTGDLLKTEESYKEHGDKIRQAASMLAVTAQAIAEHPSASELKAAAPNLRDAAIVIARSKTITDAGKGVEQLQAAVKGEAKGAPVEYDWAKLTRMHPSMEEMNARATLMRRLLRRPKDPAADSRNCLAIATLALATHADTHEVKNPGDIPKWNAFPKDLADHMASAARAVKAKDKDAAAKHFAAGMETCNRCHEVFKDQ